MILEFSIIFKINNIANEMFVTYYNTDFMVWTDDYLLPMNFTSLDYGCKVSSQP